MTTRPTTHLQAVTEAYFAASSAAHGRDTGLPLSGVTARTHLRCLTRARGCPRLRIAAGGALLVADPGARHDPALVTLWDEIDALDVPFDGPPSDTPPDPIPA